MKLTAYQVELAQVDEVLQHRRGCAAVRKWLNYHGDPYGGKRREENYPGGGYQSSR